MSESIILSRLLSHKQDEPFPTQLNVELTHRCNLRCSHCYLEYNAGRDELTADEWVEVMQQCLEMGIMFIAFTGGEAFLRPDTLSIAGRAKELGLFFHFQSNGTCIDRDVADELKRLNPTMVELTIMGDTPKLHDGITGSPGSFEKALAAASMLLERSIRVKLKTTVISGNWKSVQAMRRLAEGMGAAFQPDPLVMPGVFGGEEPVSCRMNDEEFQQFALSEGWDQPLGEEAAAAIAELDSPEKHLICAAARYRFTVTPSGEVIPCVLWRVPCGNIREQSLREIWEGEPMAGLRKTTVKDMPDCRGCKLLSDCVRCPGLAYMESGDSLLKSEENCRMSRIISQLKAENRP